MNFISDGFVFLIRIFLVSIACWALSLFARLIKKIITSPSKREIIDNVSLGINTTVISVWTVWLYIAFIMVWSKNFSAPISIFYKILMFVILQLVMNSLKYKIPHGYAVFFGLSVILLGKLNDHNVECLYMKFSTVPLTLFCFVSYIPVVCVVVSFFR